jgi:hypothetical protein
MAWSHDSRQVAADGHIADDRRRVHPDERHKRVDHARSPAEDCLVFTHDGPSCGHTAVKRSRRPGLRHGAWPVTCNFMVGDTGFESSSLERLLGVWATLRLLNVRFAHSTFGHFVHHVQGGAPRVHAKIIDMLAPVTYFGSITKHRDPGSRNGRRLAGRVVAPRPWSP